MARYFFQLIDGKDMIDHDGTELAGPEEARVEAIVLAGGMLKDHGAEFWNDGEWQLRVVDEAGDKVCALTFSADQS